MRSIQAWAGNRPSRNVRLVPRPGRHSRDATAPDAVSLAQTRPGASVSFEFLDREPRRATGGERVVEVLTEEVEKGVAQLPVVARRSETRSFVRWQLAVARLQQFGRWVACAGNDGVQVAVFDREAFDEFQAGVLEDDLAPPVSKALVNQGGSEVPPHASPRREPLWLELFDAPPRCGEFGSLCHGAKNTPLRASRGRSIPPRHAKPRLPTSYFPVRSGRC